MPAPASGGPRRPAPPPASSAPDSDVSEAGRSFPPPPRPGRFFGGRPLFWNRWWFGPLAGAVVLIYLLRTGPELLTGPDASGGWYTGQQRPSAFPGAPPAGRSGSLSARSLARSAWWTDGSSSVLEVLAACLEQVPAAAGSPPPAAAPAPDGGGSPSSPPPLPDALDGLSRSALTGYYRDLCLGPLAGSPWDPFVTAYGQRPRGWILQYLAAAEDQFDRFTADGSPPAEAWERAFGGAPGTVRALRSELLAVYGRSAAASVLASPAAPDDASSGPR